MKFATIASGSSGNCIYICGGRSKVLVDAGCTMKLVKESLAGFGVSGEELDGILITHEHSDHINKAAQLARRYHIPIYASERTWEKLPFYHEFFPWERHTFEYGMEIGDLALDFFKLSHDAVQPVGMIFSHQEQRVGIATDTGIITPSMLRQLYDAEGLVLEANHDRNMVMRGPYPAYLKQRILSDHGHLSNEQCGEALCKLIGPHTRHVILAHLSATNNLPDLAFAQVRRMVDAAGFDGLPISVAPRRSAHELIDLCEE